MWLAAPSGTSGIIGPIGCPRARDAERVKNALSSGNSSMGRTSSVDWSVMSSPAARVL